jgi:hypothetical protein
VGLVVAVDVVVDLVGDGDGVDRAGVDVDVVEFAAVADNDQDHVKVNDQAHAHALRALLRR